MASGPYDCAMRIDQILATGEPCFSVELFPPKSEEGRTTLFDTVAALEPLSPAYFSVTYGAGGTTREGTLEITSAIRDQHGAEAMAHLSCVGATRDGLASMVDQIAETGIENILALRGDPPEGSGSFTPHEGGLASATELIALIAERRPEIAIGASCFPEVHPEAESPEADLAYLKTKVDAGASFLITQLFFDNSTYFEFVAAAREVGITVPIIPGLMPIRSYAQITRFCKLCDATIPDRLQQAMVSLDGDERAEFELGVAYASQQAAELMAGGAPGLHIYALNRSPATRAILATMRATRPWERAGQPTTSPV